MFGPTLHGGRVMLTAHQPADLPTYVRWFADPDIVQYLKIRTPPSLQIEQEWFDRTARDPDQVAWAVRVGERVIGSMGIGRIDWRNRNGMSGTILGEKDCWGQGYATEAIALRTRYAFDELGLEKIKTSVAVPNIGSIRALQKNGYREVGIARREWYRGGQWIDLWIGEILRDDWLAAQNR